MYFTFVSDSDPKTCKPNLLSPSNPFSVFISGFVIRNNFSTSEPFDRYLVPILDIIKSLADYIFQVDFMDRPSLVYSNKDIKAAQTVGDFSVLNLLSLTIVYATIFDR